MSTDHETMDWQSPECEQISVSAEVTAYMGTRQD
jgi:hypothetical protein